MARRETSSTWMNDCETAHFVRLWAERLVWVLRNSITPGTPNSLRAADYLSNGFDNRLESVLRGVEEFLRTHTSLSASKVTKRAVARRTTSGNWIPGYLYFIQKLLSLNTHSFSINRNLFKDRSFCIAIYIIHDNEKFAKRAFHRFAKMFSNVSIKLRFVAAVS